MRRIGWFARNLLSYLLLAVVLLIVVGIPVTRNIENLVLEEIRANAAGALDSVQQVYDDWQHMMDEYTYQMKTNAKASPYILPSDGASALHVTDLMRQTVIYTPHFEAIAIVYAPRYFSTLPRLYTSMGTYDAERFFRSQYRYDQWDLQDIYDGMEQMGVPSLRGPEWVTVQRATRAQYMTYIAPMSAGATRNNRGVMLFIVQAQKFMDMLSSVNIPKDATLLLASEEGRVQLTRGSLTLPSDYQLPQNAGSSEEQVAGENCFLLQKKSVDGRRFALLIPQSSMALLLRPHVWGTVLILLMGLMVAIAGAVTLSTLVFRPVRRLTGIANALQDENAKPANEFEQIEQAITLLSEENTDLVSRMHSHNSMLRQHLLHAMCAGRLEQKEQFLTLLQEDGIAFSEDALRMIAMRVDNEDLFEERMDSSMRTLARYGLLKVLRETVSKYAMTSLGCETGEDHSIVAILSGAVDETKTVTAVLQQLQQVAAAHFGITLTIGVSDCFKGLENVPAEYRRALTAAERRFLDGPGQIFLAQERAASGHSAEVNRRFVSLEARITGTLREEKYLDCIAQLEQYVQAVRETNVNPSAARQMMTMLCATIHRQLQIAGAEVNVMARTVWQQYETIGQMYDAVAAILWELETHRRSSEEKQTTELIERCVEFMQANLSDASLTMASLAEAVDVSSRNLSRCFKEQMGVSPWQYFDDLRLKRACALLKDTTLRVGDVLIACGYVDKTNFMRKFKRQYGMTPTEYRKANSPLLNTADETGDFTGEEPD